MKQPITTYLDRIRIELVVIRELLPSLYRDIDSWFWCAGKVGFSRRRARRAKREFNADSPGSSCKVWCSRCKRYHVYALRQRLEPVEETKARIREILERSYDPVAH